MHVLFHINPMKKKKEFFFFVFTKHNFKDVNYVSNYDFFAMLKKHTYTHTLLQKSCNFILIGHCYGVEALLK